MLLDYLCFSSYFQFFTWKKPGQILKISQSKMTQPPVLIVGLLLCFIQITLLYWWTEAFVVFETSQYTFALTIQYILAIIDVFIFLMVIGVRKKMKEFLYIWVVTAVLNMILVSQELLFNIYQCYLNSGCQSFGFEEISNITYWGLLMFNSISLLLVMGAINDLKTLKENDEYMKGRRYSV